MGGMPYLADMQSAIFSPFSLPAYVLPFWWSLGVIAVMKVVVAATGTYLLARALKMGQAGAFMAGLIFGFGLFLIAWIPWPLDNVFPLIPWMLYATERLVRRPGVLPAAGLAALVALQFFGGHPESSVYALFAAVGYFVLRLLQGAGGGVLAAVGEARRRGTSRPEGPGRLRAPAGRRLRLRPRGGHRAGRRGPPPVSRAPPQLLGPHGAAAQPGPRAGEVRLRRLPAPVLPGQLRDRDRLLRRCPAADARLRRAAASEGGTGRLRRGGGGERAGGPRYPAPLRTGRPHAGPRPDLPQPAHHHLPALPRPPGRLGP